MLIDARELESGAQLQGDVCIVGGGPAGISLAASLSRTNASVILLESGGVGFDPDIQALNQGPVKTGNYESLDTVRLRMLGGTSNHWTGLLRVYTALDLAPQSWMPLSGWPLSFGELDSYYERTKAVFGIDGESFDAASWEKKLNIAMPELDGEFLENEVSIRRPLNFAAYAERELFKSPNVFIYTYASVTNVELGPEGNQVSSLRVRTLEGKRFTARAKFYVLATGGLENPRLLLNSDGVQKAGVGNQYGAVGRYFMEHPYYVFAGQLFTSPAMATVLRETYRTHQWTQKAEIVTHLRLTPENRERLRVMNALVRVRSDRRLSGATDSFVRIARAAREGRLPSNLVRSIEDIIIGVDDIALYLVDPEGVPSSPFLTVTTEQSPDPASRVALSNDRDALGMRRISLEWKLNELDFDCLKSTVGGVGAGVTASGMGRLRSWAQDLDEIAERPPYWSYHHIGTTRMGQDQKTSVVDANCRVHSVENLYVAGSSVFSTSGSATPTFTIVALAIRLADHLEGLLGETGNA